MRTLTKKHIKLINDNVDVILIAFEVKTVSESFPIFDINDDNDQGWLEDNYMVTLDELKELVNTKIVNNN